MNVACFLEDLDRARLEMSDDAVFTIRYNHYLPCGRLPTFHLHQKVKATWCISNCFENHQNKRRIVVLEWF